jgi:hypothetical protein
VTLVADAARGSEDTARRTSGLEIPILPGVPTSRNMSDDVDATREMANLTVRDDTPAPAPAQAWPGGALPPWDVRLDEPSHVYTIHGDWAHGFHGVDTPEKKNKISHDVVPSSRRVVSGTSLLKPCFAPFDADAVLDAYHENWQSPTNRRHAEYGGKSREEIKAMWTRNAREKAAEGTRMHALFERFYVTGKSPSEVTTDEAEDDVKRVALEEDARTFEREWTQFEHFTRTHCAREDVLFAEMRLFSPKHRVAGTADVVARGTRPNGVIVYDFKRCKDSCAENAFVLGWPKHGEYKYGCHEIRGNNHGKYRVQLNLYAELLRLNYGVEVEKMCIVRCHGERVRGDEAEVIEVAPCEDVVKNILNKRERELKVRRMFAAAAAAARVCVHFARKKRAKLRAAP